MGCQLHVNLVAEGLAESLGLRVESHNMASKYAIALAPPVKTREFPMMVMPIANVLELAKIPSYEEAVADSLLVEWQPHMAECLFCSHTWLSNTHPDPRNEKLCLLKELLKTILAGKMTISTHWFAELTLGKMDISAKKLQSDLATGFVWFDFFSVPQADRVGQAKAISSIASYVGDSAYFFVLAGAWQHQEDGSVRDRLAWCQRGWCRVEQLANALSPRVKPLIIAQSPTSVATYGGQGLQYNTWLECPVGLGNFTVDSDREKLFPLLESLIEQRKSVALAEGDLAWYRTLHASKAWLLKGTGTIEIEPTLEAWLQAMRFSSANDGAKSGLTPLRFASLAGRLDLVRELLDRGVSVESPVKRKLVSLGLQKGITVLSHAAACVTVPSDPEYDASRTALVKLLLDRGADPMRRGGDQGVNALWHAMVGGNLGTIQLLHERCAASLVTPVTTFGMMTWEMWTVFAGRVAVFEAMRQRHMERMSAAVSNSHAGDHFGMSMLTHLLNNAGDLATLHALLDSGHDVNGARADPSGRVLPQLRATKPDLKMVYRLVDVLTRHPATKRSAFVEFWAFSSRCAPLHAATFNANLAAVTSLLERGADVTCTRHPKRMTALHLAAMGGHIEIALRLLAAGARPDAVDAKRRTCSKWAHARSHTRLGHLLDEVSQSCGGGGGDGSAATPSLDELRARLARVAGGI
jgi:hypothetical protein